MNTKHSFNGQMVVNNKTTADTCRTSIFLLAISLERSVARLILITYIVQCFVYD